MNNPAAVFPCYPPYMKGKQFGYSVGWLVHPQYCMVWANFKTRNMAHKALTDKYGEIEIVDFESDKDIHHRWNPVKE